MTIKISRVRKRNKAPKFPHLKGNNWKSVFQLIMGIIIWIGLLVMFAISAWVLWFNKSLSYLFNRPANTFPWWVGALCTIFIFPFTIIVILLASIVQIIQEK